jgi:hypothetical protein
VSPHPLQRLASNERAARHAGFWWGLAEGTVFFIVPDVYIAFATLYAVRAGMVAWAFSIIGSLVAVCGIYVLVTFTSIDHVSLLDRIPAISSRMIADTGSRIAADGLPYSLLLILGGVPLKVYAAQAYALQYSLGAVLLWTVFARVVRIAPVVALVAGVRFFFRRSIERRPLAWFALLLAAWTGFYIFYFVRMSRM